MKKLTISSSLKYDDLIRRVVTDFQALGVDAVFPNLDSGKSKEEIEGDMDLMRKICEDHFDRIDISEGLYVLCPDGYVGTLVSVEIGYAVGKGKPVYCSEKPEDAGVRSLMSGIVGVDELEQFVS